MKTEKEVEAMLERTQRAWEESNKRFDKAKHQHERAHESTLMTELKHQIEAFEWVLEKMPIVRVSP